MNIVEGVVGGGVGGLATLLLCVVGFITSIATNVEFRRAPGSFLCRPLIRLKDISLQKFPLSYGAS